MVLSVQKQYKNVNILILIDYTCYDCGKPPTIKNTTCYCINCFEIKNHNGHNFRLY